MRLVRIALEADAADSVQAALDDAGISFTVTDQTGPLEYDRIISFALPAHAVEGVLDTLRGRGLSPDAETVILDAETVLSRDFEALQKELKPKEAPEDRISRQELRTRATELTPSFSVYVVMTLISAVVATAGLLLDSPAVVVGSMVIAPLIGPALSASVGTVVNDDSLFREGFVYQVLGVVVAIGGSALFAVLLRFGLLAPPGLDILAIPEIAERLEPDLLSLFIALGAGIAGILSLTTGISAALVGVMIAAALIPPAGAAGIAIAWGEPIKAVGAVVLVFVNLISINLAGLLTLWYAGYRPERIFETSLARRQVITQVGLYGIAVAGLSSFLVASSVTAVRQAEFERETRRAVESVLAEPPFEAFSLLSIQVSFEETPVFGAPRSVLVEIGTSSTVEHAGLAEAIKNHITERTGESIRVDLRVLTTETAEPQA